MDLKLYQKVVAAYTMSDDEIDKRAYGVAAYYGLSFNDVDCMNEKLFIKKAVKVETRIALNSIRRFYLRKVNIQTDANKLTFGQFIEILHWLKDGEIESYHMIAASLLKSRKDHKKDAERMSNVKAGRIVPFIRKFLESFNSLLQSYSVLLDIQEKEALETNAERDTPHPFLEQYGWIFSAKQVADYEGIKLNDAYDMNVINALNDLAYLKSFNDYKEEQS